MMLILVAALAACRKHTISPDNDTDNNNPPLVENPHATNTFTVANVLQSNMVVQRNQPFKVWGYATPGATVHVNASWHGASLLTTASATGLWQVNVPATEANAQPQTLTCQTDGYNAITFNNILIGDVWLCAGQSNMVMPLGAVSPFLGVTNYSDEIASSDQPQIRTLTIDQSYQTGPLADLPQAAAWQVCSPANSTSLSAVAYFFALKLRTTLNIPIGIMVSAINGSNCEDWMNKDAFTGYPAIKPYSAGMNSMLLYNGMISPLTSLQIKGFIWYQGENNQRNPPADYTQLNSALIKGWRSKFGHDDLPFYLVQLTPFAEDYYSTSPTGGDQTANWLAYFREAQAGVTTVPNTGMAITMDVGEAENHHPRNKRPVGERLALLALHNTYAQNVAYQGPRYASFSVSGNTITINFVNGTANGLNTTGNAPLKQYFFVAGPDHLFRLAQAQIVGSTVQLTTPPGMALPVQAVRYAFTNAPVTNLQNDAGLPAEPFRSDNW